MTVRSANEGEQRTPERILVEAPLSFAVLESVLPIGWGELEDAVSGPVGQQVEEVSQVNPGLDAMHLAAGNERDENGVGKSAILGADEEARTPNKRPSSG